MYVVKVQHEPKNDLGLPVYGEIPKIWSLKMHFCIQVADVDLDAAALPDATATSGVSDVDAYPNHKLIYK